MAKSGNPNILDDLAPVIDRTSPTWRYKSETVKGFNGESFTFDDPENLLSDNDAHREHFPIPAPTRRA